MKEEDVVKKGAKDVEVTKKKTSNNTKQPSNENVKSKSTSSVKKVTASKASAFNDAAKKKTTTGAKKTGTSTTAKKSTATKTAAKASSTKTLKIDSLEDIFESSAKQMESESTKASKTKAKASSTKKANTTKKVASTKPKAKTETATSKSSTTKKEGTAKKVTANEKSSKIKINSKEKATNDKKTTTKKENKKEESKESKKVEKIKEDKKKEKDEVIEEIKEVPNDNEPEEIDLSLIDEELQKKSTIPDADFKKLIKDSALSIIYFIGVLIFLVFDLIVFGKIPNSAFIVVQNVFSFILLGAAISFFEIAYRKDDTSKCIIGIEALFIGIYTLTIPYICQIFKGTFSKFLLSALVIIVGYYFIKACVVFYKKQNRYLRLQENFTVEEDDNEFNLDDEDEE